MHARHNVLIVEDYADAREVLLAVLHAQGFDAVGATSGSMALDMLTAGLRPCVILLDAHMPGMDGWELRERMKLNDELARLAVVMLSANPTDHARAQAVGIREFLQKPIEVEALVAAVDRHCGRRKP